MSPEAFRKNLISATTPLLGDTPQSTHFSLRVKQRFEGKTILDFYDEQFPRIGRETWIEKIESGNLKVNGQQVDVDYQVKTGELTEHSSAPQTEPAVSNKVELLFEDDALWAMNKPAPLPMHAGGRFARNNLVNFLETAFPEEEFKIIHRLDANTTGLVLFAKTEKVAQHLALQFKENTLQKSYLALVEGILEKDEFSLDASIAKETDTSGSRKLTETGQSAFTKFEVLKRYPDSNQTLLLVTPKSGRTNQIRIHLASLGHPIVGDFGYKDPEYFKSNPLTYEQDCLFLHAWKLNFIHPSTGTYMELTAPIPQKFPAFL